MPQDVSSATADSLNSKQQTKPSTQNESQWLRTPQPVKRVFDKFPLLTYDPNELPQGCTSSRKKHALYIFTTKLDSKKGRPSYNPGCLKWQAYLHFQGLDFITIPSNNHASPTGTLPFLLPAASTSVNNGPVPSTRLQRWTSRTISSEEGCEKVGPSHECGDGEDGKTKTGSPDMRFEAYISLLDYRIRNAYLYNLYLCPANFSSIVRPLYIDPTTSNPLVRLALSYQLRTAAKGELLKQTPTIDVELLFRESEKAFSALSGLLGTDQYFFGEHEPGMLDAAVFAYTNILLDGGMQWKERRMTEDLGRLKNLVTHRDRVLDGYFPSES